MRIKPFRAYDENDVLAIYSLAEASGDAGCMVEYQSLNPSNWDGYNVNAGLEAFPGMSIPRYVNNGKVKLATSGNEVNVLGMLVWDVRETDALGRKLIYDAQRYAELHCVTSGQTVPVLKRGMVFASGFTGTPNVGSGIGVSNNGLGDWTVLHPTQFTPGVTGTFLKQSLGRFLSQTGADGFALAYIDVK